MTEHESEQFYYNLRQKLDDYGSAPPEAVWAGIRQQLPARSKRRRLLPLLLLLGFFTTGSLFVATKYWPGKGKPEAAKTSEVAGSSATATGPADHRASSATASTSAPVAAPLAGSSVASAAAAGTPTAAGTNVTAPAGRIAGHAPGLVMGPIARRRRVERAEKSTKNAASATATNRQKHKRALLPGGLAGALATGRSARAPRIGSTEELGNKSRLGRLGSLAGLGRNRSKQSGNGSAPAISNAPLALRNLLPEELPMEEPEVVRTKRRAPRRPTRRELRLRNWSIQVAGGPAMTYRLMGGSATQLEKLERPGLGFAGQLTGTYALSRQLAVSAGLGYAEYANSLQYQLKKSSSETTQQKDFRDVYRFFVIPVQAQLTMGRSIRWRYGLTGGGTVALLTSARTTEGTACNCGQREWTRDMPDTIFSRTNLALTGGAFASYQVAIGQWVTIRPQAQLFLNSLTAPSATRTPRRPWGLGVQLGYSWDLDPRKR